MAFYRAGHRLNRVHRLQLPIAQLGLRQFEHCNIADRDRRGELVPS